MNHRPVERQSGRREVSRREMLRVTGAAATAGAIGAVPGAAAAQSATRAAGGQSLVRFEARPGPVVIDASKTAVIVVDMQNDFGTKGGMFDRAGIDISMIQAAVAPTAKVLASARKAGIKI